jgi:putative ABC transport system ATP-binding protein
MGRHPSCLKSGDNMELIDIRNVSKIYQVGDVEVRALDSVTVTIEQGALLAIMGHSGSGKSTLMNILGCLDKPTEGHYFLEGTDVAGPARDELSEIRNRKIGFVFQGFNLLPRTSALENVELPMLYSGVAVKERKEKSLWALQKVGLEGREHHAPNQLSGGQQQRVAIARAIVNQAPIILADEPTGNLDSKTSVEIMELFQKLNEESKITVILVTHEPDIAAYARRAIRFTDGRLVGDGPVSSRASLSSEARND